MIIEVTADDIKRGVRNNPWRCPIALAGRRAFGVKRFRSATLHSIWLYGPNREPLDFALPVKAKRFMDVYDRNGGRHSNALPFSFKLTGVAA